MCPQRSWATAAPRDGSHPAVTAPRPGNDVQRSDVPRSAVGGAQMIIRLGMAVAVAATTLAGLSAGTAAAVPACADFHWIGAAGSGQRDGAALAANGGMGDVVYQSYQQLATELAAGGQTMTAEAVQYPAAP